MFGTLKDEPFQQTYAKLMADELNAIRNDGRPMPSQAKLSKLIENRTRNWYLIQGLSSEAGFQVQPTSRLEFWRNEFHNYRRELGPDAPEAFYRDFPDYFEATITLSVNETGLNATDDSWREAVKYRDDINTNLKYGWLYAGAANMAPGFDNGVYTAQQAAGWRSQKSPAEAAKENVVSQGWIQYRDFAGLLNTKLETRKANGGKITITAKSNADLKDYRDKFVDQLTRENPAWREDYDATGSGSSLREFFDVTEQAKKDHPELAKRGDFEALAKYREGRAIVQDQLANVGLRSLDSYEATSIREAWETWVANLVNSDLGFQQMYQRARLETDDLSVVAENEK